MQLSASSWVISCRQGHHEESAMVHNPCRRHNCEVRHWLSRGACTAAIAACSSSNQPPPRVSPAERKGLQSFQQRQHSTAPAIPCQEAPQGAPILLVTSSNTFQAVQRSLALAEKAVSNLPGHVHNSTADAVLSPTITAYQPARCMLGKRSSSSEPHYNLAFWGAVTEVSRWGPSPSAASATCCPPW